MKICVICSLYQKVGLLPNSILWKRGTPHEADTKMKEKQGNKYWTNAPSTDYMKRKWWNFSEESASLLPIFQDHLNLPCFTLSEVIVFTKEDMMIDSSSGHTERF